MSEEKRKNGFLQIYSAELEVVSVRRNLPLWMLGMESVLIQSSSSFFYFGQVAYHTEFGFPKKYPELFYDIYKNACTK